MKTYTIELTDTEDSALSYVAASQQEWIDNAVHERCRAAINEIVNIAVQKCLDENISIPATREEIVSLAFAQGWVITGAERNALAAEAANTV